jgi:hypothetical protein
MKLHKAISTDNVQSLMRVGVSEPRFKSFAEEEAFERENQQRQRARRLEHRRREQGVREYSNELKRDLEEGREKERAEQRQRLIHEGKARYMNYFSRPYDFIRHEYMPEPMSRELRQQDNKETIKHLARGERLERLNKAGYNILNGESKNWTKSRVPSELTREF